MTQILGESRNNSIFEKTLNVIGPIKNKFSKPDCKVHIFLQENAINSLNYLRDTYKYDNRFTMYLTVASYLEAKRYGDASIQISLIKALSQNGN